MAADKIPPAHNLIESQGQHQDKDSYMTAPSSTWKQDTSYQRFECKPEMYDGVGGDLLGSSLSAGQEV